LVVRCRTIPVIAGLLVAAASSGCGGGAAAGDSSPPTTERFTADDYAAEVVEDMFEDDVPVTEVSARCIADAMLVVVTAEDLVAAGIEPHEYAAAQTLTALDVGLPADASQVLAAALAPCDIESVFVDLFVQGVDGGVPNDVEACMVAAADGRLDGPYATSLLDGSTDALTGELAALVGACPIAGG
jgi:hypothetical protein